MYAEVSSVSIWSHFVSEIDPSIKALVIINILNELYLYLSAVVKAQPSRARFIYGRLRNICHLCFAIT